MTVQFADPVVTRVKYDRLVADFNALRSEHEAKGWFLVEADFPTIYVVVGVPQLRPPALLCGVLFDYTNYDADPPSVQLVEPFTRQPYSWEELPAAARLLRAQPQTLVQLPGIDAPVEVQGPPSTLVQPHGDPKGLPFLCVAGTREYHDHPGHSGDSWDLHRAGGAGALVRLLDVIYRYGVQPMQGYAVNLMPQVSLQIPNPVP